MVPATLTRPTLVEHPPGFGRYVTLAPDDDVLLFLEKQLSFGLHLLANVSESQALALHAPYTWSIKQVVGHITDAERIFAYRALRIARNDPTPLPSFDENAYVQFADFNAVPLPELLREFELARRSHLLLFHHIAAEAWARAGTVSNHSCTARALVYVIAGHAQHHLNILEKRLGI